MSTGAPAHPRRRFRPTLIAALVSILLVGAALARTTSAGFSATTGSTNAWTTGTLTLTDNDAGAALFTIGDDGPLARGQTLTRCITITYNGTAAIPQVRLATQADGLLAPRLSVTIDHGTPAPRDCTGYSPVATDYTGTMAALNSSHGDYPSGTARWDPATASGSRTYRFTITVQDDNAAQGLTGTGAFTWTVTNNPSPPMAGHAAAWVWQTPTTPAPVADLITYARAHGLKELLIAVPWNVATYPDYVTYLQALRDAAAPHGITLAALGGATDWVTDPTAAQTWMTGAINTGAFTRIHLDIEPWTTPEWSTQQQYLAEQYLARLDQLNATPGALPIDVDLGPWLADVTTSNGQNWLDQIFPRVGKVAVMAFRDQAQGANGILDIFAATRARLVAANEPYRLGVETNPNPECPTCTFAEEGNTVFVNQTRIAHNTLRADPTYLGLTVEDYTHWRDLELTTP